MPGLRTSPRLQRRQHSALKSLPDFCFRSHNFSDSDLPASLLQDPRGDCGPTQRTQNNPPIARALT